MAIQEVNVGTIANDGTGDDPRTGISKVNSNFTDTTNMASKLAQTSTTDATTDRGLLVGAFGLGGSIPDEPSKASTLKSGMYRALSSDSGTPDFGSGHHYAYINLAKGDGTQASQFLIDEATTAPLKAFIRSRDGAGTWTDDVEMWTDVNYQPETAGLGVVRRLVNASGGAVASSATVAGSSLLSYRNDAAGNVTNIVFLAGTYKNVSGGSIPDAAIGDFVRIV